MKELGRQRKNLKDDLRRLKYKRVSGSLPGGQGYADKRKKATVNRYLKLRRKTSKDKQFGEKTLDRPGLDDDDDDLANTAYSSGTKPVSKLNEQFTSEERNSITRDPFLHHGKEEAPKHLPDQLDQERRTSPTNRWKGSHRYSNAQKMYQEKQTKRQNREQVVQDERMKREKALENYKKKKVDRNRKFNQRTKRGQPIMKHQIDFLLEKIKAQGD